MAAHEDPEQAMSDLHERIAKALGWSVKDAQSLSMHSLRDLVRPVDPQLAQEMSHVIQSGAYIRATPAATSAKTKERKAPPAPAPARTKEPKRLPIPLPFERKPQVPSRWSDRYHKEHVPIDRMIATQHHVTEKGLKQYRLTAPKHDIDLPLVYRIDDGQLYIADGHHRIVAALKRGDQSIMARVIDIGDPDNPREPPW
jgi:hypothetical protein